MLLFYPPWIPMKWAFKRDIQGLPGHPGDNGVQPLKVIVMIGNDDNVGKTIPFLPPMTGTATDTTYLWWFEELFFNWGDGFIPHVMYRSLVDVLASIKWDFSRHFIHEPGYTWGIKPSNFHLTMDVIGLRKELGSKSRDTRYHMGSIWRFPEKGWGTSKSSSRWGAPSRWEPSRWR